MNYCLNYWRKSKYLDQVEEINIDFTAEDTDEFENFIKFLAAHPEQKVNVCVDISIFDKFFNNKFDKLFSSLWNEKPETRHFAIRFYKIVQLPSLSLIDERIEAFLKSDSRKCPCYLGILAATDEDLEYMVNCRVDEVFLTGSLAFDLPFIAHYLKSKNIRIRLIPNLAQGSVKINPMQKFFVRPEDTHFYEEYVDVFELYERGLVPDVVYEAYKQDEEWFGNLEEIIYNLGLNDFTLNNRGILAQFGQIRTYCGRRCFTHGDCNICPNIKEISEVLGKNNIAIRQKKSY